MMQERPWCCVLGAACLVLGAWSDEAPGTMDEGLAAASAEKEVPAAVRSPTEIGALPGPRSACLVSASDMYLTPCLFGTPASAGDSNCVICDRIRLDISRGSFFVPCFLLAMYLTPCLKPAPAPRTGTAGGGTRTLNMGKVSMLNRMIQGYSKNKSWAIKSRAVDAARLRGWDWGGTTLLKRL